MNMRIKDRAGLLVLLTVVGMILFYNLSGWGVTETSEARYAEIAREMYRSGDYMHPRLLGIGHYHKPPLTYWITAISYHIFGVSAFAARFFLQCAVLLQAMLVYAIGMELLGQKRTALLAAITYLSCPAVIMAARALTTDAYLATFIMVAIYGWIRYRKGSGVIWLYLFYLFLGVGFMTKGPVVFIVPLVVVIFYNRMVYKEASALFHHFAGGLLFLMVGFTWFFLLYLKDARFLDYFVFDHTVRRFATDTFRRSKPFFFYLWVVPLTSFPWMIIILKPLFRKIRNNSGTAGVLAAWVFIPLLFFSLSRSKLILYVLPVYPGIALAATNYWAFTDNGKRNLWLKISVVFQLLAIAFLFLMPHIQPAFNFSMPMFILLCIYFGAVVFFVLSPFSGNYYSVPVLSLAFTLFLTVYSSHFLGDNAAKVKDLRSVAHYINQLPNADRVMVYNRLLPSLAFHLDKVVVSLNDGSRHLKRETQFETTQHWKKNLMDVKTERDAIQQIVSEGSVLVVREGQVFSPQAQWLEYSFQRSVVVDGWRLYYTL